MAATQASLTFLGAAGTVTGSKYLITLGERRILIDAGMFQGEKKWRLLNWEEFPVPPDTISDIVLTHAHMDHCGYLPALVRAGFDGPVWCTEGTRQLAEIVLRDAGFLAERDARDAQEGGWSKHNPPLPIYTSVDVEHALPLLTAVRYDEAADLGDDVSVRFTRAGHILGSSSVTVSAGGVSVLFSGDLGRHDHPVLRPSETPPGTDYVVIESTYGDRDHPEPVNLPHEQLADAIRRTVARGGSVLIPAFAIDRTEIVLRALSQMRQDGRIPGVPIYLNSPMATAALDVYRRARDELRPDLDAEDLVKLPNLVEVRTTEDSMKLTSGRGRNPSIIVSSSGMLNGGRVLHHLERMLPDARDSIVLTGYQAVGTRGRALSDGAAQLKMRGVYVPVRAEIIQDQEFSVHADRSDLIDWLHALTPAPRTIFVTHGEEQSSQALADAARRELGCPAVVPVYGERVVLAESPSYAAQPAPVHNAPPGSPTLPPTAAGLPAAGLPAAGLPAAGLPAAGLPAAGTIIGSDLRVRERDGNRVVLEGTITLQLN